MAVRQATTPDTAPTTTTVTTSGQCTPNTTTTSITTDPRFLGDVAAPRPPDHLGARGAVAFGCPVRLTTPVAGPGGRSGEGALGLPALAVRETRDHSRAEAAAYPVSGDPGQGRQLSTRRVARLAGFEDKALSSASWAGMANNLNGALAWGVFPLLYAAHGLSVGRIGLLAALYPAVWRLGQLVTGWWSNRIGRKHLIAAGMLVQAAAIGLVALGAGFPVWALVQVLLGAGTAMVYPTLLAVIGDVAHPAWRARAVGVYRLWRDGGFAVGALPAGAVAGHCLVSAHRTATTTASGPAGSCTAAPWARRPAPGPRGCRSRSRWPCRTACTSRDGTCLGPSCPGRCHRTDRLTPIIPLGVIFRTWPPIGRPGMHRSARWFQYSEDTPGGNRKV